MKCSLSGPIAVFSVSRVNGEREGKRAPGGPVKGLIVSGWGTELIRKPNSNQRLSLARTTAWVNSHCSSTPLLNNTSIVPGPLIRVCRGASSSPLGPLRASEVDGNQRGRAGRRDLLATGWNEPQEREKGQACHHIFTSKSHSRGGVDVCQKIN